MLTTRIITRKGRISRTLVPSLDAKEISLSINLAMIYVFTIPLKLRMISVERITIAANGDIPQVTFKLQRDIFKYSLNGMLLFFSIKRMKTL